MFQGERSLNLPRARGAALGLSTGATQRQVGSQAHSSYKWLHIACVDGPLPPASAALPSPFAHAPPEVPAAASHTAHCAGALKEQPAAAGHNVAAVCPEKRASSTTEKSAGGSDKRRRLVPVGTRIDSSHGFDQGPGHRLEKGEAERRAKEEAERRAPRRKRKKDDRRGRKRDQTGRKRKPDSRPPSARRKKAGLPPRRDTALA